MSLVEQRITVTLRKLGNHFPRRQAIGYIAGHTVGRKAESAAAVWPY